MAGGLGTRCRPLTLTRPKPLLKAGNTTILEHNLDQLDEFDCIKEVIIITGYMSQKIEEQLKDKYQGIIFVKQEKQLGTGNAVLCCEQALEDKFIVMNGDDLYSKKDIEKCIRHEYSALACEQEDYSRFGVFILKDNYIDDAVEKPKEKISNLVSTGLYVLDKKIFAYLKNLPKSEKGEYFLLEAVKSFAKENKVYCETVEDYWCPIGHPWDLLKANKLLLDRMESEIQKCRILDSNIYGKINVGKGTLIEDNCVIKGPVYIGKNCHIGPFAYIRPYSSIGDNCRIGEFAKIKNSIIFENSAVPHDSFVGDSIVGSNVNFGIKADATNLKLNRKNVKVYVNYKRIDTGLQKFGAIIGDGAQIAGHVKLNPGAVIQPNELVFEDK